MAFLCYRQSDGKEVANCVCDLLYEQQVTSVDPQSGAEEDYVVDVYFDQTAPAGKDWTAIHERHLKRARASNTYMALKEAGVKDVRINFVSWNEWSRDPALPIEEGLPFAAATPKAA